MNRSLLSITLMSVASTAGVTLAGGPPANDDCATPMNIAGVGVFNFDNSQATTGAEGQGFYQACNTAGLVETQNDLWYCWTADCTGQVLISTCGQTQVDTKIQFWTGCGCPLAPSEPDCCDDDSCGLQSRLLCDVVCGEQYMIQLGQKPSGMPGGAGSFTIDCIGEPCDGGGGNENGDCEIAEGQCCFGRPNYDDPDYQAFNFGPVGVMTAGPGVFGNQVVTVYDFSDFSTAIPNTNFPATRYSHPSWNGNTLGSIFGVTLDSLGNIYVTPSTVYFIQTPGIGGWGDVYRIDSGTGAVSVFTAAPLPNTGPGLGNIVYDCENDQYFVTNHEDGKIYRLDSGGNVASSFDPFGADDGSAGFCPLGERLWGVTVHGGRVYFSVWAEDQGRPSAVVSNEIWSVALAGGDFSGAPTLEVVVPPNTGQNYSNPVADIRFTQDGRMFVAERSMGGDTGSGAHDSRMLEFVCENGIWAEGASYGIGVINTPGTNSAGGCDVDYRPGERIWCTADAIQFTPDTIYGAQGTPDGGGDVTTSVLLDYQGNLSLQDKTSIGDIAISCPTSCAVVEVKHIECDISKDGFNDCYNATVTITNQSGQPVKFLLFPGGNVIPNVVVLNPILQDGQTTQVQLQFCGLEPGQTHCVEMIMADEQVDVCCHTEICFDTPECDCLQFDFKDVFCDPAGGPDPMVIIGGTHLGAYTAEHMFLLVESPAGVTVSPNYIDLPSIPQYGIFNIGPITITGANPGDEVCIRVTTHADDLNICCSEVTCFEIPQCGPGFRSCDLNQDGVVDFSDLLILLSSWGPCQLCPADLDHNGVVDFDDLLSLLACWTI